MKHFEIRQQQLQKSLSKEPVRQQESKLTIHPFFGYVYNPRLSNNNSFGFKSKYDFTLCGEKYCLSDSSLKNPLVVGVFGGSFAHVTAIDSDYLEAKLKEAYPDRTPVVINFGIGGHALPQAYYIFSYFKDFLDVAIFLDGLNELWNSVENNGLGFPPEYAKVPHFNHRLSLQEITPENLRLTNDIFQTKKTLLWLTQASLLPGIKQSVLTHRLWEAVNALAEQSIQNKMLEITQNYSRTDPFFSVSNSALLEFAASKWADYHKQIHLLGAEENILTLHFIQPNPYVENSKKLTPSEIRKIKHSFPIESYVVEGYPKLLSQLPSLQSDGVIAEDLTLLYQNIEEDIWTDSAHANSLGSKLVLDHIFEVLSKNAHFLK